MKTSKKIGSAAPNLNMPVSGVKWKTCDFEFKLPLNENILDFQKRNTTVSMRQRLISLNPQRQLGMHLRNVSQLRTRLPASIKNLFQHRRERFHSNASLLESLSPLAVLHRGFSLNQKEDGSLLRSVEEVKQGDNVEIRLEDGKLKTRVLEKTKNFKN